MFLGFLCVKASFRWTSQRRHNLPWRTQYKEIIRCWSRPHITSHHACRRDWWMATGWKMHLTFSFIWTIQAPHFYNIKLWILFFSSEAFEVLLYEVYKQSFLSRWKKHQPIYWSTKERIKLYNSEVTIILSSVCHPSILAFIYLCI